MLLLGRVLANLYLYDPKGIASPSHLSKIRFSEASTAELAYKLAGQRTHSMYDFGEQSADIYTCVMIR